MESDERIVLIGESIRDPYGGACKVTRGLTKLFNDRIIDTPISEAGIMGMATGMSLAGKIPILEIMFSDFLTLTVDQIHNMAYKIHQHHHPIKVVIRTLDGAGKMYGPTHSQDMTWLSEALKMPYWRLTLESDVLAVFKEALAHPAPVVMVIEHKPLYDKEMTK